MSDLAGRIAAARAVPIVEVLGRLGRQAMAGQVLCPNPDHPERRASARVYPGTNSVHCFRCGRSWDVVGLVVLVQRGGIEDALVWLEAGWRLSAADHPGQVASMVRAERPEDDLAPLLGRLRRARDRMDAGRYVRAWALLDALRAGQFSADEALEVQGSGGGLVAMSLFRLVGPVQTASRPDWQAGCDHGVLTSLAALQQYVAPVFDHGTPLACDFEATSLHVWPGRRMDGPVQIVGLALSRGDGSARYVPVAHGVDYQFNLPLGAVIEVLQRLDAAMVPTLWFNYKYDGELCRVCTGWEPTHWEDVYFAVWLADCEARSHGLKDSASRLLGLTMPTFETVTQGQGAAGVSPMVLGPYACADADCTGRLWRQPGLVAARARQAGIYALEKAFLPVLRQAMRTGCFLDDTVLADLEAVLGGAVKGRHGEVVRPASGRLGALRARILAALGKTDLNLEARGQLGQALVDAGVPITERTETGQVVTNKKVIEAYGTMVDDAGALRYPVVQDVIRYGALGALDRNYVRKLRRAVGHFGAWVRFPFGQLGAPTGRMNSGGEGQDQRAWAKGVVDLNVQSTPDAPEDDPEALDVRAAWVPADPMDAEDWVLVAIDFAGIELRIAANLSREPVWLASFAAGTNLHLDTARRVTGDPRLTKASPAYKTSKNGNFAFLYGAEAPTLARTLRIPLAEAQTFTRDYWRALPTLRAWVETTHARARAEGLVRTVFGRERPLQAYYGSRERSVQGKGDRESVSHLVQGTAADLFKAACVRVHALLQTMGWQDVVQPLLFVHDELVLRVRRPSLPEVLPALVACMEGMQVGRWPVPLLVEAQVGANWGRGLQPWARPAPARPPVSVPVRAAGLFRHA